MRNEAEIRKLAIDPINFLDLSSVKSMINVQATALIGHNRHATQGAVNNNNAHPFTHGDITLAHNGTLTNKWQLERDFKAPKFDTDSELVCWLIDNYELEAVIPELKGAFALTWWDSRDSTMNIIRNDERPLHVAGVGCNVYWASEKRMLAWILDRNEIGDSDTTIYQPKVGMHLAFKYSANKMQLSTKQLTVAKKSTPRTKTTGTKATGVTTTGSTNKSNVTALPPTKLEMYKAFGEKYGFTPEDNCYIYAYVDQVVDDRYASSLERVDVLATLSCDPYADVRIYFADSSIKYDGKDTIALRLKVRNLKKDRGHWLFTASNDVKDITVIKRDDLKLLEEMDKWEDDQVAPFNVTKEVKPQDVASDFRGYNNQVISYLKFEEVLNKGCCVCAQTFDPVEESLDRSCVFVRDDEVICGECANDEGVVAYYGFQLEKTV